MISLKKMSGLRGEVTVPGDKSISHRAVMLGAISSGTVQIDGFLQSEDCLATIACFNEMGIKTEVDGTRVKVCGKGLHGLKKPSRVLYTGNSGTTTRLLCGILAGQEFESELTGDASICKRPMDRVATPLKEMGADIEGDFCPLKIFPSKLNGISYEMPVASAQVKTALLLAGLYSDGEVEITEKEKSRDHTERMLKAMGANVLTDGLKVKISETEELSPINITVPGDISSAAFYIAAGSIMQNSEILIKNVGINPTRTGILDVAKEMGAYIELLNLRKVNNEPVCDIFVKSSKLKGVKISGDIIPRLIDEIPIIAVMALVAEGETVIADASELKVKETNRIKAICTELAKCGADIYETDDGMIIRGGKKLVGASFSSYGDHRIAMSMAVLAQIAEGECEIDDEKCVAISYPGFFADFYALEDRK